MSMFHRQGPRTEALVSFLRRRARTTPARRKVLDRAERPRLFSRSAVVFTDTADFTARTARDGILHFLMLFERLVEGAGPALARAGGTLVKVEGDSLLLRFGDVASACRGVVALEAHLRALNRGKPANERLHFSYGIGFGEMLDIEGDLFGLEVNLASKLGEDLARPGEVLLTPAAVAALDAKAARRLAPYKIVRFGRQPIPVQRFRLPRASR
jgi:adenylate cyclase